MQSNELSSRFVGHRQWLGHIPYFIVPFTQLCVPLGDMQRSRPTFRECTQSILLKPQANTQTRGKTRTSPVAHLVSVPPPRGQSQKPGMGNRSRK